MSNLFRLVFSLQETPRRPRKQPKPDDEDEKEIHLGGIPVSYINLFPSVMILGLKCRGDGNHLKLLRSVHCISNEK